MVGLGKVGSLVADLLHHADVTVTGIDQSFHREFPFKTISVDVADTAALEKTITGFDAVVSCLPYFLNTNVAKAAMKNNVHYFDLTEDVPHTQFIIENSESSPIALVPQCGLAPGLIGIVGSSLVKKFDTVRSLALRVGALPKTPIGLLGYNVNWSADGIINEYLNDAEVISHGVKKTVPSLSEIETVIIDGIELEAFITSGGLGTMTTTYEGKIDTLDYKTLRYPGHCTLMRFLSDEMRLGRNRKLFADLLLDAKPQTTDDVVYLYAAAVGERNGALIRDTFVRRFVNRDINGTHWRAISWTTAASCCAVVELVSKGVLPQNGFVRQEDILFEDLIATSFGSLFTDEQGIA